MSGHCKIISLCCMFEIFHNKKYSISERMNDGVNKRYILRPEILAAGTDRLKASSSHSDPSEASVGQMLPGCGHSHFSTVSVDLGHGGVLDRGKERTEARLTGSHSQRLQFDFCSVPFLLPLSHTCRSPLEEAPALTMVPCSGDLPSPPNSAVASWGSRPSAAPSQLLMLILSYQNNQMVVVYYSSC